MVVIAIFRVIKAPFIDGNLSIIDCYAEAVHVFRNFVHVIKNRLVGAPVHVIEKTVHVHENCCSRVLRILTHLGDLLKGLEKMVFLDSGYIGCTKRAEIQAIPFKDVSWYIAAKPSAWKKELSISENFGGELGQALVECVNVKRQLEHAKASVRCSIEWSFLWLKRIYGYAKVRYRGLAKNHSRALTLFALYNCNRLRKWCAPPRLPC